MALVLKDRVKQAAAAPGTGTITLGATATGFQSFASVGNGNTTYFAIVDPVSGDWEVNYGVYTSSGTTLTRNATPLSSSAGGALINFTGAVDVFLTYPSSKAVWQDVSGLVAQQSFGAITATSAALTTGTISTAPVSNTDIVNKQYADAIASGIHFHEAVNLATTAALPANTYNNGTSGVGATLTGNANGALSVDSTLTTASERILVKNEAAGANNGVYTVTQVGSAGTPYILTRATDFDSVGTGVNEIDEGDFFLVTSGTANVNTAWVQQTPPPITIGTTALVFQQFSAPITYTAGTGLSESPTYTFNIANTGTAGTYGSASAVPVFVTNAQGQVTSVTNTAIAINGSAVSGNISGQAGSVANSLTLGTYLTGGTYNGSAAVTATVDATSANTASKVVARDASGNFSAGTITATFSGNTTSATNIAGGAANQVVYQSGSGATAFATAPSASNQVFNWNGSAFTWSAGTISGVPLGSNLSSLTAGTYLTGTAYNGSGAQTWTVDATSANTASTVVARDASGNFSAGTITAALTGNATTATSATTATNLAGGAAGTIPYQSAAGTTVQLTAGTSGYILQANGAAAPSWVVASTAAGVNNGTLTMNVSGTGLSGSQSFTANQSSAATFTVTSNATNANTASTIVARDGSGNFSAGTITAALTGNVTGNVSGTSGSIAGFNNPTTAATADTIVYRDSGGDIYQRYGFAVHFNQSSSNSENPTIGGFWTNSTTDNYNRKSSPAHVISQLGLLTTSNYNSYAPTLTGTGASGTWGINITGSAGSAGSASSVPWSGVSAGTRTNYGLAFQPLANDYAGFTFSKSVGGDAGYFLIRGTSDSFPPYTAEGITLVADANSLNLFARGGSLVAGGNAWVRMGTGSSETFRLMSDYSYSLNSSRAPIFYDSNDTNYYVDPNSNSRLVNLGLGGVTPDVRLSVSGDAHISTYLYMGGTAGASGSWSSRLISSGGATTLNTSTFTVDRTGYGGGSFSMDTSGNSFASASFRAPIFYDSDNTGYYIDPASTSDTALRMRGGALFGPNVTWGQYLAVGTNGNVNTAYASIATTDGNLHMDAKAGSDMYLNYYAGNAVRAYGTFYTPIMYDLDNTAYYVDPASTSNFVQINLQGILRRNTSAAGYLEGNYPTGVSGSSSAAIYTIGGSYQPTSTTLGNMYGIGYTIGNSAGMGFVGNWGMYVASNGTARIFLDSDAGVGYATGSFRAPIFYDYNDTGYYVDPAGTSQFSRVEANFSIEMRSSAGGGYPAFLVNQYADVSIYRANNATAYIGFSADGLAYLYNDGTNFIFSGRGLQAPSFGVGTAPSGTAGEIRATNNITAYYSSDIKFKTNVRDIPNAIETVESIGGKLFDWTDEYIEEHGGEDGYFIQKEDFGVIAQDVLKMFPVAVRTRPDGSLAVDYEKLSALAFAAISKLSTRVKSLEARI